MTYSEFISHSICYVNWKDYVVTDVLNQPFISLKCFKNGDLIYTPACFLAITSNAYVRDKFTDNSFIALFNSNNSNTTRYKGVSGFLNNIERHGVLRTICLGNDKYRACNGCIFTENYEPLLITYCGMKYYPRGNNSEYFNCEVKDCLVLLSTKMYDEAHEGLLEKNLRNSGVKNIASNPLFIGGNYLTPYRSYPRVHLEGSVLMPTVIITPDFNDFIRKPVIPDVTFNEENLNKFLADNALDIINTNDYRGIF